MDESEPLFDKSYLDDTFSDEKLTALLDFMKDAKSCETMNLIQWLREEYSTRFRETSREKRNEMLSMRKISNEFIEEKQLDQSVKEHIEYYQGLMISFRDKIRMADTHFAILDHLDPTHKVRDAIDLHQKLDTSLWLYNRLIEKFGWYRLEGMLDE